MRRVVSAREQAEMLAPWQKVAEDLTTSPVASPVAPASTPSATAPQPPPPVMTNIPREDFDKILAPKGVTYDQHLDNLESHFDAATEQQKKRGRVWYRAGGDILRDIAKRFGKSVNQTIAVAASLSSRTDWNNNLHFAAHITGNYRPGENEDEWQRAAIHPSALARYMEDNYDITPGEKAVGDLSDPTHFSHRELRELNKKGYMPSTPEEFDRLADAHGGDHLQFVPPTKKNPGGWVNAPLRGFEALQTDEGRQAWLANAEMPHRGNIVTDREGFEDTIDTHIRAVKQSTAENGYRPDHFFMAAGLPTLYSNVAKAKLMMQVGEDEYEQHLKGPKYRGFFSNLGNKLRFRKADNPDDQGYYDLGGRHWTELDPELLRGTIDTQHMRAASQPHGKIAPGYKKSSAITDKQYEVYQQGLIDLTHRINSKRPQHMHLLPHQVQAIIWGKFKDDLNAIKKPIGQTFWSPTLDGITPHGDRYAARLLTGAHVHPALLESPLSDPHQTDSDDWFEAAMASWESLHQHELAGGPVPVTARRELAAARRVLAETDFLPGQPAPTAKYVLLPHWDPDACFEILRHHAAGQAGRTAAPLMMSEQWGKEVMDAANEGGFTFHDHVGDGPTDGYMVSLYKNCETKLPMQELTADHVRDFCTRHADLLARPHHYLGGWLDKGHFYLDVSVHVPKVDQALRDAIRARQLGVYDVTNKRTMDTDEEGWRRGLPGVVGSRHGQRAAAVPYPAQGRPTEGGGHSARGSWSASDDAAERLRRTANHLNSYLPFPDRWRG